MSQSNPNRAQSKNPVGPGDIPEGGPGSASQAHPSDGIPLPQHGFETLDLPVHGVTTVPGAEVVSRAAVLLVSACAEKLGLAPGDEPDIDLDDARLLIEALAGLLAATGDGLGALRQPLLDGVRTLQSAFREASVHPDAPGEGPGERLLP